MKSANNIRHSTEAQTMNKQKFQTKTTFIENTDSDSNPTMEATKVFQGILGSIESSNLNYSLSKTPFSASISLKCSFIKRYQEESQVTNNDITKSLSGRSDQDDAVKKLEAENIELRAELESFKNAKESDQKNVLKEIVKLKDIYGKEKEVSGTLEKNVAEFREEIWKIKKEKHNLSNKFKKKEQECENLKTEVEVSNTENFDLKKTIKIKIELADNTDSELLSTKYELEGIKKDWIVIKSELDNVKLDGAKESESFNCEFCQNNFKTYSNLRMHIRKTHCQNQVTQIDEHEIFRKYNCFYCDSSFCSIEDLEVHPNDCHTQIVQPAFMHQNFTCDICERTFEDVNIFEIHMKVDHLENEVFWCDICPLHFATDCELHFHIRGCHWNHM